MTSPGFVSTTLDELKERTESNTWRVVVAENADYRIVVHSRQPGLHFDRHDHPSAEVFIVQSGRAEFDFGNNEIREAGPGSILAASPNQSHAIRALGDEPLVMICFAAPNS
jgi:mannose-6-phosphate isomerase-like protein (cupin superfamily)